MTSGVEKAAFFADPQALSSLKKDARAHDASAVKEVAKQFESLFTNMLLKSMRDANKSFSDGDTLFGSDQADFYQDMFDNQLSMHLAQGGGLGLADMLVQQLTRSGANAGVPTGVQSAGQTGVLGADAAKSTRDGSNALPATSGPGDAADKSAPQPIASNRDDFIRSMMPHAEKAAREIGVDPHALLAQAALETGWGKAVPCNAAGECSYNLFGIKAGSQWSGATVNVPTLEFEDGVAVRKIEKFRAYDSPADSFRDYAKLIRNNPRYENALGTGSDVASFAAALQNGGYATDPNYASKIVAVANSVRGSLAAEPVRLASATSAYLSER